MKVPFTREHGAYGMAITTFVIGAGIGTNFKIYTFTTVLGLILFIMAKYPASMLLQRRNLDVQTKKKFFFWGFVFFYSGFLMLLPLLNLLDRQILLFTIIFVVFHIFFNFLSIILKKDRSIVSEVFGISTICISGMLGYFSSGGIDLKRATLLWLIPLLYYTASIFKIRSLILKGGRDFFRRINIFYPFLCGIIITGLAVMNLIQFSVLLCLLPLVENILVNFKKEKMDIRRTGWIEVAKSAVFGIILMFTLR